MKEKASFVGGSAALSPRRESFRLERRDFLKLFAAGGALSLLPLEELEAAGICAKVAEPKPLDPNFPSRDASPELFYWIDGPFSQPLGAGLVPVARLAVHVDLPQTPEEFVEAVIVANQDLKVIASQRFEARDATSLGRAPYAIFDGIGLRHEFNHSLYYVVRRASGESIIHRFTIPRANIRQSRLDYSHLHPTAREAIPKDFLDDMFEANHQFEDPARGHGFLTTPYQHFAGMPPHIVRARVLSLRNSANGLADGSFLFQVYQMHDDLDATHFMRYFLVLDPVGRLLGGRKRSFGDPQPPPDTVGRPHFVSRGLVGAFAPTAANPTAKVSILDCPYVHIITEDRRDAIAKITLRIR